MIGSRSMRALTTVLALAAVGCSGDRYGFFGDDEAGSTSVGGTTEMDATSGPMPTTTPPPTSSPGTVTITSEPTTLTTDPTTGDTTSGPVCGEELPAAVPVAADGNNTGAADLLPSGCFDTASGEAVWLWTAPFDGRFEFNTFGSSIDTVMTLFEGACGGPVIDCNDDAVQLWSRVVAELRGGTTVTIAVEGLGGATGAIRLNVRTAAEEVCEVIDLGDGLGVFGGSTSGAPDRDQSGCGGDGASDVAFLWSAPFAGQFTFRTSGSTFDPLLYARLGSCAGPELACNDDFASTESRLQLFVTPEDGPLVLVVDGALGGSGEFALEIVG